MKNVFFIFLCLFVISCKNTTQVRVPESAPGSIKMMIFGNERMRTAETFSSIADSQIYLFNEFVNRTNFDNPEFPLYSKDTIFIRKNVLQAFMQLKQNDLLFNYVRIKITQINGINSPQNSYYAGKHGKLHILFYPANVVKTAGVYFVKNLTARGYDLACEVTPQPAYLAQVSQTTENSFDNMYLENNNSYSNRGWGKKLDSLRPFYRETSLGDTLLSRNTIDIYVERSTFTAWMNESSISYEYAALKFGLTNYLESLPSFMSSIERKKDYLTLFFYRTNAQKTIIPQLGVYDINDHCPPPPTGPIYLN